MGDAYQCDRCGGCHPGDASRAFIDPKEADVVSKDSIVTELCPDCDDAYHAFMNN